MTDKLVTVKQWYTIWYTDANYPRMVEFIQEYSCTDLVWCGHNCWAFNCTYPVLYEVLHSHVIRGIFTKYSEGIEYND